MSSIGPGATNMITGAATATVNRLPVLLFPSDYFANRLVGPGPPAGRAPRRARRLRLGRLPPRLPLLRPHLPARAAPLQPARGVPRPHRPGRDRRRDDLPARGRAGRGLRLAGALLRAGASGASAGRAPRPSVVDEVVGLIRAARRPAHRRGRRRDLRGRRGGPRRRSPRPTASRSASRRPARASLPWNHPRNVGPDRLRRRPRGQPAGAGRGPRHRRRHPDGRLRHGVADGLPGPGRDVRRDQRQRLRRGQDALRRRSSRMRARRSTAIAAGPRRGRPRGHVAGVPPAGRAPSRPSGTSGSPSTARPAARRATSPSPRSSASSTTPSAATPPSSAPRARSRATCSSCGGPRTPRPTTSSTATRAWATRSRPASASRWPSRSARSWSPSATART